MVTAIIMQPHEQTDAVQRYTCVYSQHRWLLFTARQHVYSIPAYLTLSVAQGHFRLLDLKEC